MKYQVVYDVRNAGWSIVNTGEMHFLLLPLGIMILLIFNCHLSLVEQFNPFAPSLLQDFITTTS